MRSIRRIEPGPYVVATTFAGGGGSSLGYRMAGMRVAFANEVVPEARATYAANAAPYTVIDGTDIRQLDPNTLLDAVEALTGSRELDVLDGSPPCMSFSTAGKRHKGWGEVGKHTDGTNQRSDDLFYVYCELVAAVRPRVFVAENVPGMARGVSVGYFNEVLRRLKAAGYRVSVRELDAQWLGVPQARRRLIFQGVREDAPEGIVPAFPKPLPYTYSVREACPWIVEQGDNGGFGRGGMRPADRPSGTIGASPTTGNGYYGPAQVTAPAGITLQRGPKAAKRTASFDDPSPTIAAAGVGNVREYQATVGLEKRQLTLEELRRLCSFPDDFALPGKRLEGWARLGNAVPPLMMRAVATAVTERVLQPWDAQSR
jgi:DNA (cytosine-5)-methyltransferase 1